jgi:enoyl-CoA hydratase
VLLSARRFPAADALAMGLVNRVVPAAELRGEVLSLARDITQNAPLTVTACKAAIREAVRPAGERDLALVQELVEACFGSEDYREGQAAFAQKRAPVFTGR